MRSLFFKIFLWFWAAMALVGAALYLAVTSISPDPLPQAWREEAGNALAVHAATARDIYERDGDKALASYFLRLRHEAHIGAWLLDKDGNLLAGYDALPDQKVARILAGRTVKSGRAEFELSGRVVLLARRAPLAERPPNEARSTAANGKTYVLFAVTRRPRFGRMPVEPQAQALRVLVVFLTAGVVCYGLVSYLTSPLVALRQATRRLAEGDLSARTGAAESKRRDELADLGHDFDAMAERIEELVTSERRLVEAQRRLLGDISHELRSPLTRLGMALALARRRAGIDAEALTPLDRIKRESERLNALIGQLLQLTRLESGEVEGDKESVDLERLVREVAEDAGYEARADNKRVQVTRSLPCRTTGSKELLRSAIENVVRNAVRYTKENTTVEITLDREADKRVAVIRVRDHGEGVPEAALSELFRSFYRVDAARDRDSGGVGLGLAITERAVRSHGGTCRAVNAPDGGLQVELHLPTPADEGNG